jgi:hypothetical protein
MIIEEKISKTQKIRHIIQNDEPIYPRSYSSLLLLNDYYKNLDVEFGIYDWRYYFIARRTFLRRKKKENGGFWICHYCGEKIYKIQERNKIAQKNNHELITVDHKNPKEECEDITDSKNFIECCYKCNKNKGNKSYEEFTQNNKKHESRKKFR